MKVIVFDWDGTLADTLEGHYAANHVAMTTLGVPFDRARYRANHAADWRLMYTRLGVAPDRLDEANALWHGALDDHPVAPLPGARSALDRLRAAGLAIGLVTASRRSDVEPQLHAFGFDRSFDATVFGDDLPQAKPHPAPLLRAIELLRIDVDPALVAYVGDVPDDMRMARAVGARPIGIESLLGDPGELRAAGAVHVALSVEAWVDTFLPVGATVPGG